MEINFSIDELPDVVNRFLTNMNGYMLFAFHGEMGAGKTTFIHALCTAMGIKDHISSPTFSIINEYDLKGEKLYHIDLYRIKDEEEARNAGVEDCLYSGNICFVEWPEKAPELFGEDTVHLYLEVRGAETRNLKIDYPAVLL